MHVAAARPYTLCLYVVTQTYLCLYAAMHRHTHVLLLHIDTDLQAFGNEPEEGGEGHAPKRRALRLDKRVALDYLCVRVCVCVCVCACVHACVFVCVHLQHSCMQASMLNHRGRAIGKAMCN